MNDEFKSELVYLLPVLGSLLFGALCAWTILTAPMETYNVTPFPEGIGSFGNALYFVVLVALGALILYLLLKRRNMRTVAFITGAALTAAIFTLSFVYLSAAFSRFTLAYSEVTVFVLSAAITVIVDIVVFRVRGRMADAMVLCLGGALGTFLGFYIPPLSAIAILGFLAVYDVIAVYRGPVGKIARSGLENLRGLSFSFRDVQMGLGDLTFYSMLASRTFFNAGPIFFVASAAGLLIGVFLSFKMLETKGVFPGLPFPTVLGLIPLVVSLFVV